MSPRDYRATHGRWIGVLATLGAYGLLAALFIVSLSMGLAAPHPLTALTVMQVTPRALPRETPPRTRNRPQPPAHKAPAQRPSPVDDFRPLPLPLALVTMPMPAPPQQAIAPHESETATPATPPAPHAPSNGPDSWEGRVLAQLSKHRRYPRMAQMMRQQGVPSIRFVIDRDGRVLSTRLERSSGVRDLDQEALALPKRAQPLPRPPQDRPGDTLELIVPVEFFIGPVIPPADR